ncbi:LOW QUALITY PROTEIN: putative wall-associated receptor kinase-like 11 [Raphanus sativus]|uniref:LOW QUALITY PROTEIN: putative wall-associated receptor kinase-like 11 n=1 Tax=Raphanus sativus TaxID=3726 RepID=A0A6J0KQ95_RAPSA|nr:LOW QUALITY PROTEIN: putative wall-associated receptor kinase-like 11 [Raphanus sativus]
MRCYNNYSMIVLLSLLLITLFLASKVVTLSTSCQTESCGNIKIPYPFGIQEGCYLDEWYKIECKNATFPFLFKTDMEVVNISLPGEGEIFYSSTSFGSIRLKIPITSVGCSGEGNESGSVLSLKDSPFFLGTGNSLVAVGCNSKASLTYMEPIMVGCELNCTALGSKDVTSSRESIPYFDKTGCTTNALPYTYTPVCTRNKGEEERSCDGNGCCRASLPNDLEAQQVIGVSLETSDHGNSTNCRVAFLTDEVYTLSNVTEPQSFFAKGYATVRIGWVTQTNNLSFINSLSCKNTREYENDTYSIQRRTSCICNNITVSGTNYANCGCNRGYTGNPYLFNGCEDIDECILEKPCDYCENVPGTFNCSYRKTWAIVTGVGSGFALLVLVGGMWLLRKCLKKRRMTRRKRKFFKRNGGLLLQQQLNTNRGNVEKTRIFTSRELEKATENFSQNRILGQGGQGTVYKGMLVDGKTVAVKKSKVVDEDKVEEFINEVVILSQVNHRHVVKLLGCCLETEVPVLIYEFIPNGNLFQQIHEESDDYTMIWGVRLRIAVDIAGALSYLHSAACSPIYHRDIKSTNILLDEKYRAKVSDFGTSRSVTVDHTHWTTVISGTVGYVDPEYYGSSQYTEKSDVYSFGVVLVELITGEKPIITLSGSQEIRGLADHFRAAMKENRFFDIMDARIRDACKPEQVMAVANLARRCLNSKGKKRPYMTEVFTELERISSSPENALVDIENDDGDDAEEEGMNMIEIADSWTVGVTAPAFSTVSSPSYADVKPLFPRPTW